MKKALQLKTAFNYSITTQKFAAGFQTHISLEPTPNTTSYHYSRMREEFLRL